MTGPKRNTKLRKYKKNLNMIYPDLFLLHLTIEESQMSCHLVGWFALRTCLDLNHWWIVCYVIAFILRNLLSTSHAK
ncbi:hypothetical protein SAMN06265368_4323 [Cohaesibacter gelatinilyticus]|uniref:Uncharacterized protein n=1 Tax=Cohaesibacter gelatinilyticus TaxID=372072 RepID=A0A285PM43_9HYPH|nr:hypothetical protein SAMN06265368_4323 [Cohaesibacter gelatinilyticus]